MEKEVRSLGLPFPWDLRRPTSLPSLVFPEGFAVPPLRPRSSFPVPTGTTGRGTPRPDRRRVSLYHMRSALRSGCAAELLDSGRGVDRRPSGGGPDGSPDGRPDVRPSGSASADSMRPPAGGSMRPSGHVVRRLSDPPRGRRVPQSGSGSR